MSTCKGGSLRDKTTGVLCRNEIARFPHVTQGHDELQDYLPMTKLLTFDFHVYTYPLPYYTDNFLNKFTYVCFVSKQK